MGVPETSGEAGRVFVVDDDDMHLRSVVRHLRAERFEVEGFESGQRAIEALEAADGQVHTLLVDLYMPEMTGIELLRTLNERWPAVTPILMTGKADVATAVEAMRGGAYDYLMKPIEPDTLVHAVRRATERARLLERNLYIQRQLDVADRVEGMVGTSRAMREIFSLIATVAPTEATVLVLGESGTGKELVARAVHRQSKRSAKPFIGLNCGALTESVLESELFGHVRGAFTGAVTTRRGLFEEASGGTLFLDEVGELSPATQVRLLRVLQEGEVRPVGANGNLRVDVRVIAATNRNLRSEVDSGKFRRDLYYRLEVVTLELPPLRERLDDLAPLVHHLLRKRSARLGKKVTGTDEATLARLAQHDWPGNVRELENVIERAIVMAKGEILTIDTLPPQLRSENPRVSPVVDDVFLGDRVELLADARSAFERRYVQEVLKRSQGNLSAAARMAGLDRSNFRRLLRRLEGAPELSPNGKEED